MAELALATQELADLRVREKDTHDDASETEEKLMALIKRGSVDVAEVEQLLKKHEDLLWTVEELCTECDLSHQERPDAQQWIILLEGEL